MKNFTHLLRMLLFALLATAGMQARAQSNQYLDFDGKDDFVLLEDGASLITNSTRGLTMAGWFYTNALVYGQGMMGFRGGVPSEFYIIQLNNGELECRFRNSSNTLFEVKGPANTIVPQVWQHIAWVYDGTKIYLYINGNLKGSKAANGIMADNTVDFAIGKSLLGGYNFVFGGRADEVSVWNRGLSQSEIQTIAGTELEGNEDGLVAYYKFNQGVPGGDNTSITKLISEVGAPAANATLMNFALTGATSNFNGTLDLAFQAISFPQIPNQLLGADQIALEATATSGLEVQYKVLSGPAILQGKNLILKGDTGLVKVEASQPGDSQYDPADPVVNSFMVLDPATHVPDIDVRNPLAGDVYVSSLSQIQLSAVSTITYPELFSVSKVQFKIDGKVIDARDYYNTHYTAWWTPPAYGNYTLQVISTNNFGASSTKNIAINVKQDVTDIQVTAVSGIWLGSNTPSATADGELPSYLGAFDKITATLEVQCPTGGCGEWDRVASVDAQGHDGRWFEIIRYITPYGTPCSHTIDLTDYMSILQGKVKFRVNCATLDNGYVYNLSFNFRAGAPAHKYSHIQQVWKEIFPFGQFGYQQPVDTFNYVFPENTVAAKLKLVSTGHGWGDNNTDNASEFYKATHDIWVNNVKTFSQLNWVTCRPNPDGCQPQNGTWYYDRAGWCPGSIAQWFDFDLSPYVAAGDLSLMYKFYDQYIDYCSKYNPDCVTGTTCADCNDGFNPVLDVACNLVSFSDSPFIIAGLAPQVASGRIAVSPNPSKGRFELSATGNKSYSQSMVYVYDNKGNLVKTAAWNGEKTSLDLTDCTKGFYLLRVVNARGVEMKKLVVM